MKMDSRKVYNDLKSTLEKEAREIERRYDAMSENRQIIEDVDNLNPMLGVALSYHDGAQNAVKVALKRVKEALEALDEANDHLDDMDKELKKRTASVKRIASMSHNAERRYDASEWVAFYYPKLEGNRKAERLQEKFEERVSHLCDENALSICEDEGTSTVALKSFQSLIGDGTGLWDFEHPEASTLESIVKSDRRLGQLQYEIESMGL
jgi:chromosome segregation ATPase